MADQLGEQLSTLMDDECSARETSLALRRLIKDEVLRSRWERYHLIGDVIKGETGPSIDPRFSERIRAAIDAEPTVHASPTRAARSWQKPAIGFALAASVAAMAVITLQPWNADPATSPLASSDASEPRVAQASAPAADNRTAERLNDYLVSHSSLASMNSVYGVLPYVRMASHTGGR